MPPTINTHLKMLIQFPTIDLCEKKNSFLQHYLSPKLN